MLRNDGRDTRWMSPTRATRPSASRHEHCRSRLSASSSAWIASSSASSACRRFSSARRRWLLRRRALSAAAAVRSSASRAAVAAAAAAAVILKLIVPAVRPRTLLRAALVVALVLVLLLLLQKCVAPQLALVVHEDLELACVQGVAARSINEKALDRHVRDTDAVDRDGLPELRFLEDPARSNPAKGNTIRDA